MSRVPVQLVALFVCTATCAAASAAQPSTAAAVRALAYLRAGGALPDLSAADLSDILVSSETTSPHSGVTHVYLRQRHHGIPISGADITVSITRDGTATHTGTFIANVAATINMMRPALTAREAADRAITSVGATLSTTERAAVPATLVYHPTAPDRLRLAWQVGIETADARHAWVVTVDATSGALLDTFDRVVSAQENARV